jgi:hypothetical protein
MFNICSLQSPSPCGEGFRERSDNNSNNNLIHINSIEEKKDLVPFGNRANFSTFIHHIKDLCFVNYLVQWEVKIYQFKKRLTYFTKKYIYIVCIRQK